MATIQCKMCGGMVDLPQGLTSGECPYCGSVTTFPKASDDRSEQLYNRAEHFRQLGDFDKAVATYEELVRQVDDDPEPYWGLVISRFGIEYVEDPVSHERIPTCHRVQFDSILSDGDYQRVLELSFGQEHDLYEAQAKRIAEIQKDILAISAGEKPYDVFICYKETTDGGSRTKDSTLAQDIYYQLTNVGLKVFFARITLEDKLGQQYEPYIFAALNSAKVMLVIGSKREYFNAVWVKNEWSRFLSLMRKDRSKLLIPCYQDMDAYDIPEELSMLQNQDMSKIGFLQDLLRGIKKVVGKENMSAATDQNANTVDKSELLLRRARMHLLDKDWQSAVEYVNKVLDIDPENGEAYLLFGLAERRITSLENPQAFCQLTPEDLLNDRSFSRAKQYGTPDIKEKFSRFIENARKAKNEKELEAKKLQAEREQERENRFEALVSECQNANTMEAFEKYLQQFRNLEREGFTEAEKYRVDLEKKAHIFYYNSLVDKFDEASSEADYQFIATELKTILDVFEAQELLRMCEDEITCLQAQKAFREGEYSMAVKLFRSVPKELRPAGVMGKCLTYLFLSDIARLVKYLVFALVLVIGCMIVFTKMARDDTFLGVMIVVMIFGSFIWFLVWSKR